MSPTSYQLLHPAIFSFTVLVLYTKRVVFATPFLKKIKFYILYKFYPKKFLILGFYDEGYILLPFDFIYDILNYE